jgi:hypothetical protein
MLKHEDWADYEDALVTLLSSELNIGAKTLYRTVFFETYPRIVPARAQLT